MHQPIELSIPEALDVVLHPENLLTLALHSTGVHDPAEIAPRLEAEAMRSVRAADTYASEQHRRYDIAAGEQERARALHRLAAALRTLTDAKASGG